MKVFVSSTSRDLADHRAAAIRALRRLGHEVVAMEEFTAAPAFPLDRVLRLVRESDAYVVIVAWRYGFVPDASRAAGLPEVPDGRQADQISITEWEYLVAREYPGGENRVRPGQEREPSERPILPFILAESAPWPPQEMDGFNPHATGDPGSLDRIRAFRATLTSDHVVSFFSRPEDLEALVSAAITSARLSRGVQVNRIRVGDPVQGGLTTPDSDYAGGLIDVVGRSGTDSVVTIDIATAWWSTRLYLLAFLLDRLTGVRRILVVDNGSFVGLLPVGTIVRFVPSIHEPVTRFEAAATARLDSEPDVTREAQALIALFKSCFATDPREPNPGGQPGAAKQGPASRGAGRRSRATTSVAPPDPETTMDQETRARSAEHAEKLDVTGRNLSRWFQDSIITSPIRVDSIDRLLPIDLVRIFDYPGDFVPVITRRGDDAGATGSTSTEQERTHVIDKPALSLQLAQAYVSDLVKEATGSP